MSSLIPQIKSNLPVASQDDAMFNDMSTSSDFLGRLKLYSKGKAVDRGLIKGGQWGIPVSDEKITVLGSSIDLLILARVPKAMNFSDRDNIVTNYDPKSAEYQEIQKISDSKAQDTGCVYGVSFLVYERNTKQFLEYFASSATARRGAGELYAYLPEKQQAAADEAKQELEYLVPVALGSRYIEKGDYSWFGPTTTKSSTPIEMPDNDQLVKQLTRFKNPMPSQGAEKVSEKDMAAASGGRAR